MFRRFLLNLLTRRTPFWQSLVILAAFFKLRAEMMSELKRAEGRGLPVDKGWKSEVRRDPARWEDKVRLLRFVDPGRPLLVIDVGGHRGRWLEDLARIFTIPYVLAFEPVPALREAYAARTQGPEAVACFRDTEVNLQPYALSDRTGKATMQVDEGGEGSSLEQYREGVTGFTAVGEEEVELTTLDSVYGPLRASLPAASFRLLKIDAQGHEGPILRGSVEALKEMDVVQVECSFVSEFENRAPSFGEVVAVLRDAGFHPVAGRDYGRASTPYCIERDVIFVRERLVDAVLGWD